MFRFYTLKLHFSILKFHIEHAVARDFWQCLGVAWNLYFIVNMVLCLLFFTEIGNKPLKFGKIRNHAKNVHESLWGIEPGPTDPKPGVYTTRPSLNN